VLLLAAGALVAVGVDVFRADFLVGGGVVGDGFLSEPDAFHGDSFLLDHGAFLVRGDLVFLLAEVRTVKSLIVVSGRHLLNDLASVATIIILSNSGGGRPEGEAVRRTGLASGMYIP
jgi:hypothetical protein